MLQIDSFELFVCSNIFMFQEKMGIELCYAHITWKLLIQISFNLAYVWFYGNLSTLAENHRNIFTFM